MRLVPVEYIFILRAWRLTKFHNSSYLISLLDSLIHTFGVQNIRQNSWYELRTNVPTYKRYSNREPNESVHDSTRTCLTS